MVVMETSSHVDSHLSKQIVPRYFLEKVAKFGSVCFNIKKVINVQSRRGQNSPPPPPLPGLNRVKPNKKVIFQQKTNLAERQNLWLDSVYSSF